MHTECGVQTAKYGDVVEVLGATLAGSLLLRFILAAKPALSGLTPIVWLYLPLVPLLLRRLPLSSYGYSVGLWRQTSGMSLLIGLGILVAFAALVSGWRLLAGIWPILYLNTLSVETILLQLILVVIPEELFFRGYVHERLQRWATQQGLPLYAVAILLGATLFTLAHVIVLPGWWRVAMFFPGCIMGGLRVHSSGLLAPTLFHWLANLLALTLRV